MTPADARHDAPTHHEARGARWRCSALCVAVSSWHRVLRVSRSPRVRTRRRVAWPSERPPRPLAARDVKFPPYQIQTLPNGLQVVAVLHHEQPVVSMRLLVRAGSALGSEGQARPRAPGGVAARSGHDDEVGRRAERRDRFHRRRDGRRRRHRPDLRQHGRDEGQLRDRHADAVGHGAASGVRAGGDRAAAAADAVGAAGQLRGSRVHRRRRVRSAGLRLPSVRHAADRHAGDRSPAITRDDLRRVPPAGTSCPTTPSSPSSAT